VLPLQFLPGENAASLGLSGTERFDVGGIADGLTPKKQLTVTATKEDGTSTRFDVIARVDSNVEIGYYHNGGILQTVLRRLLKGMAA
jgi:aconitate hydratase